MRNLFGRVGDELALVIGLTRGLSKQLALYPLCIMLALGVTNTSTEARSAPESFADLAKKLLPSVVNISTTSSVEKRGGSPVLPQFPPGSPFEEFFREFMERQPGEQQKRTALGSGFIVGKSGIIVTNNHVIQGATEITVILHNKTRLKAKIIGKDSKTDLAVLKVETKSVLPAVSMGDSDKLRVGDWVIAIGNPFGLGGSVSAGIVSARGRNINSGPYDDFIQTDASINRGNSGGPLFNMEGEVVGINTAIFSPQGYSIGVGLAIPSSTAVGVVTQLQTFGRTRRGWLGVKIQQVTKELAEGLGLKKAKGALVAEVTKASPAVGRIKTGDVILFFDGQEVQTMRNLPRIVANTKIGKSVPVIIWRKGKKITVMVAVGEMKEEQVKISQSTPEEAKKANEEVAIAALGLKLAQINSSTRGRFKLKESSEGVVITSVDPKGTAAEQHLKSGEVIIKVDQTRVRSPEDVQNKVREARKAGRKSILMLMERRGGPGFVALRLGQD